MSNTITGFVRIVDFGDIAYFIQHSYGDIIATLFIDTRPNW